MIASGHIEFHPENGDCPHFVVLESEDGMKLSLAYQTVEIAEEKLPKLVAQWNAANG